MLRSRIGVSTELNKNQGGLLPRLQCLFGCQYLSDLYDNFYTEDILHALREINIAPYSMEEWVEAYRRITGDKPESTSREMLAGEMAHWLKAGNE